MAQNISLLGASYTDVPAVKLPKTGGGTASFVDVTDTTAVASDVATGKYFYTASGVRVEGIASGGTAAISVVDSLDTYGGTIRTITAIDISDTTAVASDVATGKYFYTAAGVKTAGTGSGGGGGLTQHEIHLEFSDSTDIDIEVDYDNSWVGSLITSTTPATYGQKTVTLAQLDGTTWYEPSVIPLNTELVDYTKVKVDYYINGNTGDEIYQEATFCSDYLPVDYTMTFSFIGYRWFDLAFYDSTKTYISGGVQGDYNATFTGEYAHGTLNASNIPSTAAFVRLSSYPAYNLSEQMSFIRTA